MLETIAATPQKPSALVGRDFIYASKAADQRDRAFQEYKFRERLNDKKAQDKNEELDYFMMLAIIANSGQRDAYVMPQTIEFKDGTRMSPQEFFDYIDALKTLSQTDASFGCDLSDSEQLAELLDDLICPDCPYMHHLEKHI